MAKRDSDSDHELSPELQAFEAQLASLLPTTGRLERDRFMFEAGKAAAEAERATHPSLRPGWIWPTISTVMTVAATFLLALVLIGSNPKVVEKPVSPIQGGGEKRTDDSGQSPRKVAPKTEADRPSQDSSGRFLASLLLGGKPVHDEFRSTYFEQRSMLLARGDGHLPEHRETPSAEGGRSNTRVSYADLLDELTLEAEGFAPGEALPE